MNGFPSSDEQVIHTRWEQRAGADSFAYAAATLWETGEPGSRRCGELWLSLVTDDGEVIFTDLAVRDAMRLQAALAQHLSRLLRERLRT